MIDCRLRFFWSWFVLTIFILCLVQSSYAEIKARDARTFTCYLENDGYNDTDREYTGGAKLTWSSKDLASYRSELRVPTWSYSLIEHLPFVNEEGFQRNISVSLGHNIYSPEDIERVELIEDERPYAGVTYLGLGFHSKNTWRMDTLEFGLGIIGPHSYAEQVQTKIHERVNADTPRGWDNQLSDELVVNIYGERKWKLAKLELGGDWAIDFIPHIGAGFGNALISANMGSQIRMGWCLPNDYGTFIIRPGSDTNAPIENDDPRFYNGHPRLGCHVFAGFDGSAVARDILLDGNTFSSSPYVDKYPFWGRVMAGISAIVLRMKLSFSYVVASREYKTQKYAQEFGSVTVSVSY